MLKFYNIFGIDVCVCLLVYVWDEVDVCEVLVLVWECGLLLLVIGGGSNLLLICDVEVLVLCMVS